MTIGYCLKIISIFCLIGFMRLTGAKNDQNPDNGNVRITSLNVPSSIENGTQEFTIMDCEYSIRNNNTKLLTVAWFFNNNLKDGNDIRNHLPIYKWVFGWKKGIITDALFKNRIDLNYKASEVPWEMYRAIKILNPTTELTGKYSCQISAEEGDVTSSKSLIVYSKPKSWDFQLVQSSLPNSINVSCWARGSYPAPKLILYYGSNPNDLLSDVEEEVSWNGSTYDIRITKVIDKKELNLKTGPTMINCDLKIPNTSYLQSQQFLYGGLLLDFSENDSWTTQPIFGQRMAICLSVLFALILVL